MSSRLRLAICFITFTECFCNLKERPDCKIFNSDDIHEIAKNIINNKPTGKIRIYPYVEIGLRLPFWLTKGLFEIVNPFTKTEYMSLDNFDYGAKKFSDAIHLKPIDEINKYCFSSNYGLCPQVNCFANEDVGGKNSVKELYDSISSIFRGIDGNSSNNKFKLIPNKDLLNNITDILDINKSTNVERIEILKKSKVLQELIKSMTNDVNKDNTISLLKNKDMALSQSAFINLLKFSFIKAASDNYVYQYTEKCISDYCTEYNESFENLDNNLSKLLFESGFVSLNTLDDICTSGLISDSSEKNAVIDAKSKIIDILYNTKLLKSKDDKNMSNKTLNELGVYINDKNETEAYITFCDERTKINILLEKNYKNIFKNILGDTEAFINKLTNKKLLPELPNDLNEEDREAKQKKDLLTLHHKLLTLKKIRKHKAILKNAKKENTEFLKPFNYRAGVNFTYYFNRYIGLNVDLSLSYSRLGFNKSLFLPNNFLPLYFYYLYALHVPTLYGNIYKSDNLTVDDVLYHNTELKISNIVIEGIIGNIAKKTPFIGDTRFKDKYAFDNYLNVINYYSEVDYSLCDIKVKLEQINLCLKFGLVFNLNSIINKKSTLTDNIMNEIITNFGLYFNFQRIKIKASLNNNYSSPLDNSDMKYFTTDILSDALVDVLINLGIWDTDTALYNMKCAEMILFISKNIYNPSNIIPKNNNILRYINSIFDDNLPENSMTSVFNTFKVRYLFEIAYRLTIFGYSIVFGCEFIFNNPLNMKNKQNLDAEQRKNKNITNIKLPVNIEILPNIGFSKVLLF